MSRGQSAKNSPAVGSVSLWIMGARPRTLLLAISPIVLGSASAYLADSFQWGLALMCLVLAVSLQVGVNYANDFSDGVKGTDQSRVGPVRLTASGLVAADRVKVAAVVSFAIAALIGLVLVLLSQLWWLLVVGAFALVAAWTYTGGKKPYGYRGLGELVVFVFFGLIATSGTAAIQTGFVPWETWLTGSAIGFFASAVLLENNLRDRETDQEAGKNTLAVRLGDRGSRILILMFLAAPYVILGVLSTVFVWAPLVFGGLLVTIPIALIVWAAKTPKELVTALQLTSVNSLVFAGGLGAAIAL